MQRCPLCTYYTYMCMHLQTLPAHTHSHTEALELGELLNIELYMKTPLNLSIRPQGHISINHLQLHMISCSSLVKPPLPVSFLELCPAFLHSHAFPYPKASAQGIPHLPLLPSSLASQNFPPCSFGSERSRG